MKVINGSDFIASCGLTGSLNHPSVNEGDQPTSCVGYDEESHSLNHPSVNEGDQPSDLPSRSGCAYCLNHPSVNEGDQLGTEGTTSTNDRVSITLQ